MQKRGQVTVFLIVGVVVFIIIGVFFYLSNYGIKSKINQAVSENTKPSDADIVKAYAESCLKLAGDNALFERIGPKGGFIEPAGDMLNYQEPGIVGSAIGPPTYTFLDGKNVPFYLEVICDRFCPPANFIPAHWEYAGGTPATGGSVSGGAIRIDTKMPDVAYYISGPEPRFGEKGSKTFTGHPPGTYSISPDPVSGFDPDVTVNPPSATLTSTSGVNFVINYKKLIPDFCTQEKCNWVYRTYPPNPDTFLDEVSQKISNYVEVEFKKCFNNNNFKDIDIQITPRKPNPKAETKINREDVAVKLDYPLNVKRGISELSLNTFEVRLPIRLRALYERSQKMIDNIKTITETDEMAEVPYHIAADCDDYEDSSTNVFLNPQPGAINVVRFADYRTLVKNYYKTYWFQMAVKGVNFMGTC